MKDQGPQAYEPALFMTVRCDPPKRLRREAYLVKREALETGAKYERPTLERNTLHLRHFTHWRRFTRTRGDSYLQHKIP